LNSTEQAGLFDNIGSLDAESRLRVLPNWPDPERFPVNRPGESVGRIVLDDLKCSPSPLIVTGYASVDRIIGFLSDVAIEGSASVRLVLGNEPFESNTKNFTFRGRAFPDEIRDYWLERGISLFFSAKIIAAMDLIRAGRLEARFVDCESRRLHAKIYCGSDAITLGSSNFTANGLDRQLECNTRFHREHDKKRFREASQIAENYWQIGTDYTQDLLALLDQLLRVVSWQEALARACAELLEGEWAARYLEHQLELGDTRLWPSQQLGIAQALWVIENIGSVLVADPTGSGKTRMGAHLVRALVDRMWSKGRARHKARRDISVLVCPPAVEPTWQKEATNCGLPLQIRSHGVLSRQDSEGYEETVAAVRRAQILSIDEAHNFLNLGSKRTQEILANMADSVVLFTATPINRGATDLLSLVDMLGADNMEDETLRVLEGLAKRKGASEKNLTPHEVTSLRKEIQRFTLRRTKGMLNTLVDRAPDKYVDAKGKPCRYPIHKSQVYETDETAGDRDLADQIRSLAKRLKGLALLEDYIEIPEQFRKEGWSDEMYLRGRLSAIQHLSIYNVMSRLRSSRAALYEHLKGTAEALQVYGIHDRIKSGETGNLIGKLMARLGGSPPDTNLTCELPVWLVDQSAYRAACAEEIARYTEMLKLLGKMSPGREKTKAQMLCMLIEQHDLIIAFDSHLITLEVINNELAGAKVNAPVFVATGGNQTGKKRVMQNFARESSSRGVALCSDSMSEGLNLQGASAVVHLDMPSVVRIAEQRVGRVDRMDSPHGSIEAWWPNDSPEFAIRADERFVQRYQTVETLLGSNMPLPEKFGAVRPESALTPDEMIREAEAAASEPWDGIQDAFSPVRDLVFGERNLIPAAIYQEYLGVSVRVLSRVGVVRSAKPWAFFAVAGVKHGAPKWVWFDDLSSAPQVRLETICGRLRDSLGEAIENMPMDANASSWLEKFLRALGQAEPLLLPRRKQRALEQMRDVLHQYSKQAQKHGDLEIAARWNALAKAAEPIADGTRPDLETVAENWLDLIRPLWFSKLSDRRGRRRPLLLRDLRADLLKNPFALSDVEARFADVPVVDSMDERIAACILGVPTLAEPDSTKA